jgi:hypothetical protein
MFLVIECTTAEGLVSEGRQFATLGAWRCFYVDWAAPKIRGLFAKADEIPNSQRKWLIFQKKQADERPDK